MNVVHFNERSCERFRRYFDAYLDNELLVETNQDVLQHLASCAACSEVLESRARVKHLIRTAVTKEQAPPELALALKARLGTERRSFFARDTARWMMGAAAVLLLAIAGAGSLRFVRSRQSVQDDGLFEAISTRAQDVLRVGLVDHVHCTIVSERWKRFISFEEMREKTGRQALGSEFIGLVPVIAAKLGPDYKMIQAHRCVANHRQYIHFIMTGQNGAILSLVITEKNGGESFNQAEAVQVMNASGIPVYRGRQGTLEVAGFESNKYLAYVVSNLDKKTNLDVTSQMAPIVYSHLHQLEL